MFVSLSPKSPIRGEDDKVLLSVSLSSSLSLLLDQLNTEDNDCEDEEGENENEDDETAVKEEKGLELVSRDAKHDNEGKIFRSDKNKKKLKLKKKNTHIAY